MLSQAAINLLIHNEYATSWLVMSSRFNNQDEDDDGETNKRSLQSLDSDFGVASCLGFFIDQQNLATLTVHLGGKKINLHPGSFPQSQLRPNVQCSPLIIKKRPTFLLSAVSFELAGSPNNGYPKGGVFYLVFRPKTTSQDISALFCFRTQFI